MDMQEVIKCAADVAYFGEKCANIKLYDKSKKVLEIYKNNKFVILQGIRQSGKTLLNEIYALHHALFNENSSVMLFDMFQNSIDMKKTNIFRYLENLNNLHVQVVKNSNNQIYFSNGSSILFNTYNFSIDKIRGQTINLVILDEFAHYKNVNIFDYLIPCISSSNSKMIISSTKKVLNRKTNKFWELWCDAIDKKSESGFLPIYLSYKDLPHMTDDNLCNCRKNLGKIIFDKEYEVSYTYSDPFAHSQTGEKLYTPKEMSNLFNVSTSTIARWRTQNRIKGIEVSQRKFYYTQQDIDNLLVPSYVDVKIDKVDITKPIRKINAVFSKIEEPEFEFVKNKESIISLDRIPTCNVFNIDLGELPDDIAQKYISELVEKMKKHFE